MRQDQEDLRLSRRLITAFWLRKAENSAQWDKWKVLYLVVVSLWLASMWSVAKT
ncbi:MAG: hypothetical protein GX324_04995 [Aeromonadales bacterium]|nr:hypothetical protein [Aeromonadales bacterium]